MNQKLIESKLSSHHGDVKPSTKSDTNTAW